MTVIPRDAATVILLREPKTDRGRGFEVLMARRSSKSSFVPSSYVFPGGRVDEEDCRSGMIDFCNDSDIERVRETSDEMLHPEKKLGIWIAAIRETFEEMGLLFASRESDSLIKFQDTDECAQRFAEYRKHIAEGRLRFAEMLHKEGLTLTLHRLFYFSRWITPELSPKRYDTRFFIAEAPDCQEALHDGHELTTHIWTTPGEALAHYRGNKFHMVVPTIVTLEELSRFDCITNVIESTRGKKIKSVMTRLVFENDEIQEHAPDGRIFRNLVASK